MEYCEDQEKNPQIKTHHLSRMYHNQNLGVRQFKSFEYIEIHSYMV
uniref:Uncharacterized protein n=1 Tax=Anguilla anguilla TaxID=7936 RepID=A0A0E9U7T8_ANGAN